MGWPKGKPRPPTAGRRKGTPNKRTVLIDELLAQHQFNPVERMIALCNQDDLPLDLQVQILKELAQYVHPKRKAIEHSGSGGGPLEIRVVWDDASSNESAPSDSETP
jgi:hypothetical protein